MHGAMQPGPFLAPSPCEAQGLGTFRASHQSPWPHAADQLPSPCALSLHRLPDLAMSRESVESSFPSTTALKKDQGQTPTPEDSKETAYGLGGGR